MAHGHGKHEVEKKVTDAMTLAKIKFVGWLNQNC